MIFGNNHNDRKIKEAINEAVGEPYSLLERVRLGGNGSPRLSVKSYSEKLNAHFGEGSERKFVNIELRRKGVLVYIKNHINNYVWSIPYHQLSLFKSGTFNIHAEGHFIKIELENQHPSVQKFTKKLLQEYLENAKKQHQPL